MDTDSKMIMLNHYIINNNQIIFLNSVPLDIYVSDEFVNAFKSGHAVYKSKIKSSITPQIYNRLVYEGIIVKQTQLFSRKKNASNSKTKENILVFQPHCDDIALSCGGTLCNWQDNKNVQLKSLNCFSQYSNDFFAWKDSISLNDKEYSSLRLNEDRSACEYLGAEHSCLDQDIEDASKRKSILCNPHVLLKKDKRIALVLKEKIDLIIQHKKADTFLIPAAIGWHVDHRIIHDVVLSLIKEKNINVNIYLYEDYPYSDTNRFVYWSRMEELFSQLQLTPLYTDITDYIDDKAVLINFYKSQFMEKNLSGFNNIRETIKLLAKSTAIEGRLQKHELSDSQMLSERIWQVTAIK